MEPERVIVLWNFLDMLRFMGVFDKTSQRPARVCGYFGGREFRYYEDIRNYDATGMQFESYAVLQLE